MSDIMAEKSPASRQLLNITKAALENAEAEIERLRAEKAELKESRRNLETRLNIELRNAGAEIERLRAKKMSLIEAAKIVQDAGYSIYGVI